MANSNPPKAPLERLYWIVRLRWVAVALLVFLASINSYIKKPFLPYDVLFYISLAVSSYNLFFMFVLNKLRPREEEDIFLVTNRLANFQISLDLLCMTLVLHFSGGIDSPFVFYLIFPVIIASILLPKRSAYLQISFAVIIFLAMILLEYSGKLYHYSFESFVISRHYDDIKHITGFALPFIAALYIAGYMMMTITSRLKRRERVLQQTNKLLREKDLLKDQYVMRITHDIKGHLAAIQSCIQPITRGIVGSLDGDQEDLLKRAEGRAEKLLNFIKALLDITRIKLKKELSYEEFLLKDMLTETFHQVASFAVERNISLKSQIKAGITTLTGEREFIQESIFNILMNCIKYTPEGGEVSLDVKDAADSIIMEFQDTGMGIPKEDLSKVFEEFYRAPNAKEAITDGTGLGLSIVKQIIGRHNGDVWVESEEGKGSKFTIILPKIRQVKKDIN